MRLAAKILTAVTIGLLIPAGAAAATHGQLERIPPISACNGTQAITVVNETGLSASRVGQWERAVAAQTRQVAKLWHSPCARFVASGGWQVYIAPTASAAACPPSDEGHFAGCHSFTWSGDCSDASAEPGCADATSTVSAEYGIAGRPWAVVALDYSPASWTFSHEVIEMLTDPLDEWDPYAAERPGVTGGLEICDGYGWSQGYWLEGVRVANFDRPSLYTHPWTAARTSFDGN